MTPVRHLIAALLAAALPLTAAACGVCVEDKVAATYDHDVVVKAARDNRTVVFFEISGMASRPVPSREWLTDAIEKIRGVERGSVRVSLEQAAVSFAVDAGKHAPADVQKSIASKLSSQHLNLKLIRTLYKGTLSAPS